MVVGGVCMHPLMECVCMELLMPLRVSLACGCRHVGQSMNSFLSACVCESVCVQVCVWLYCRLCQRTPPIKVEMHAVTYSQMSPFLPDRPHSMRKGSKQTCVCVCDWVSEWVRVRDTDGPLLCIHLNTKLPQTLLIGLVAHHVHTNNHFLLFLTK